MPEAVVFDSHRFVKNLARNGFTERQAEALAQEQVTLLDTHLATKADIEKLRLENKAEIEKLKIETEKQLATLKADLLKWMFGALIAQTGLVVGLVVAFVRLLQ